MAYPRFASGQQPCVEISAVKCNKHHMRILALHRTIAIGLVMKFRPFNEINTICSRTIALDLGRIVVHCLFVRVHTTRLRLNQLPVACEVSQVFGKAWRTDSIEEI